MGKGWLCRGAEGAPDQKEQEVVKGGLRMGDIVAVYINPTLRLIKFMVNGKEVGSGVQFPAGTSLHPFLRFFSKGKVLSLGEPSTIKQESLFRNCEKHKD